MSYAFVVAVSGYMAEESTILEGLSGYFVYIALWTDVDLIGFCNY